MTRFVSRRTMLKALGAGGAMLAGGVPLASAKSHKVGELELLYEFTSPTEQPPFGELPENVAIDSEGNKYVSVPSVGQIWKFGPDDEVVDSPFVQFNFAQEFPVGPAGLEFDQSSGTLYSTFLSDLATQPGSDTNGVWAIDSDGNRELYAAISSGMQGVPTFPNDIALFGDSLLVTDSILGVVWKVQKDSTEVWAGTPGDPDGLLAAPAVPGALGANGIQVSKNGKTVYVANIGKGTIVKIRVDREGNAGEPEVFADGLVGPDGLAMDVRNNLYVADNGGNEIVRIAPSGKMQTLASNDGGGPLLDQPADVTFGTIGGQTETLYIVNLALPAFALPPDERPDTYPAFLKLDVGAPGLPVERYPIGNSPEDE
ncbi:MULTISPECIES: SMP-30/gluconolactonase/LRE family protein [Haloferax]|uniref:Twin-arginine translocation signal domain-containing protein n=1 Tax=Haloferax marinum TaxID=2666143 RepID=A0A6A8G682_9EURY|nr:MULTISPECIES: SMP-30/gluconolactonase/LRE family protein [Haloferax]KAB1196763.1 twin-arginine translocation signal domain-containing protein [Haloferax sp. CBA1150]MRW95773.1 twin-arginine translocation signal domain-containing protein [Haloferax marinum]